MKKVIKKAQAGVTMAQRDSIKNANRARVSKMETDRATKAGYKDVASYMKDRGYNPRKPQSTSKLEGTYTAKDSKTAENANTVKGPSVISKIKHVVQKKPECIFDDKTGKTCKKNGGRITSKKK